ncbi:transcriptional regulator, PadR family [Pseudoflavonifractor capillosus ATCC 29799]|uniref:Transcriptional regulator, PadR family n=1 Tax=Pseudoflavonifractor capillosus ATCC 29799 TaxID=411467 RepID=A6NR86_9FIRM|nr:helix-turn-helix transcriptional regulator [Pseudoflavonifractor capillosus]EDN01582.1 transcriptional regulator, PadR family [Pseudoflavonifractor capillosus ATCC 29799]
MPREKFKTLTEQMFYILLCLRRERRGADILEAVRVLTEGRVTIGSGTLYDLLEQFLAAGVIQETESAGRRRSYLITDKGREMLDREYRRLRSQAEDYDRVLREEAQE